MPLTISAADYLAAVGIPTTPGTFGLDVVRDQANLKNIITWTWPDGMVAGFGGVLLLFNLTLQRSMGASNRPNSDVVYYVGSNMVPAADYYWNPVKQWNLPQFIADGEPSTFTEPWATQYPVIYRLMVNFATGKPQAPPYIEMCWNTKLLIPTQFFYATRDPSDPRTHGGTQTVLNWNNVDASWWPSP